MKRAAIQTGDDWYDANCEHILIPDTMDLKKEKSNYILSKPDITFAQYLKNKGAVDDTEIEVEAE